MTKYIKLLFVFSILTLTLSANEALFTAVCAHDKARIAEIIATGDFDINFIYYEDDGTEVRIYERAIESEDLEIMNLISPVPGLELHVYDGFDARRIAENVLARITAEMAAAAEAGTLGMAANRNNMLRLIDRYRNAQEVANDLRRVVEEVAVAAARLEPDVEFGPTSDDSEGDDDDEERDDDGAGGSFGGAGIGMAEEESDDDGPDWPDFAPGPGLPEPAAYDRHGRSWLSVLPR